MKIKRVVVLGGSGFVGETLISKLCAQGYWVRVLSRRRDSAKHLFLLPNVEVLECDVHDAHALKLALSGNDAVINLVGILHEHGRQTYETAHHQLARCVAQLCDELSIKRLLHMSALCADKKAPSQYLRSKAAAETAVLEYQARLNITVFRPSVIFGRGDSFLNLFATLIKTLPIILLAKPDAKFQPIWVGDVAKVMMISLENADTYDKIYELGGPEIFTLRQLVQKVAKVLTVKRPIIGLSDTFSYLQAVAMSLLPIKLLTPDNINSMKIDNICQGGFPREFGFQPTPLDLIMSDYLGQKTAKTKYQQYRSLAGR